MAHELPPLFERIRRLLDPRSSDPGKPLLTEMEHTLTDGYARALELEGERLRIERQIGELTHQIDGLEQVGELRRLADGLRRADDELMRLRDLLAELQREVESARAAA
jgi:predicted nuclease with TOPRIM domain